MSAVGYLDPGSTSLVVGLVALVAAGIAFGVVAIVRASRPRPPGVWAPPACAHCGAPHTGQPFCGNCGQRVAGKQPSR